MGVQGRYLDRHSRRYVEFNPNEFNGPFTWRLSMMPTFSADPDDITTIFTILPIDSKVAGDGGMNLFFNIDGLSDTRDRAHLGGKLAARAALNFPGIGKRSMFGIKTLEGVAPVQTDERGTDVAVYFDINSLSDYPVRRKGFFDIQVKDYNSRSIDKLTADKPLFANGVSADDVVVTFDISSLDLV